MGKKFLGILAAIIIVLTIWPGLLGAATYWVILIAAVFILLKGFSHNCYCGVSSGMPMKASGKTVKKVVKKAVSKKAKKGKR